MAPLAVFDLDNTLVHSRIDFLGIRRLVIGRLVEAGVLEAPPADPRTRSIPEWLALAEGYDARLGAELWVEVDRFEQEGMLVGTVETDARPALQALRASGWRLAVLTNNSAASAEAALARFDLRGSLDLVLARGTARALKPDGAGVRQAHDTLGGGPTVMVGDAYLDGLAAERAGVGARFVAFRADTERLAAHGVVAWAAVERLAELPAVLRPLVEGREWAPSR